MVWMTRLEAAGIRPRIRGVRRLTDNLGIRIINIHVPSEKDLSALADKLTAGQ